MCQNPIPTNCSDGCPSAGVLVHEQEYNDEHSGIQVCGLGNLIRATDLNWTVHSAWGPAEPFLSEQNAEVTSWTCLVYPITVLMYKFRCILGQHQTASKQKVLVHVSLGFWTPVDASCGQEFVVFGVCAVVSSSFVAGACE